MLRIGWHISLLAADRGHGAGRELQDGRHFVWDGCLAKKVWFVPEFIEGRYAIFKGEFGFRDC